MNIFDSPQVSQAFAGAERLLGGQTFTLADGRTLTGVINRLHLGETILPNNTRIKADAIIVATRPQFTPAGRPEEIPVPLSELNFSGLLWRAEFVVQDETHVTLYCCKTT